MTMTNPNNNLELPPFASPVNLLSLVPCLEGNEMHIKSLFYHIPQITCKKKEKKNKLTQVPFDKRDTIQYYIHPTGHVHHSWGGDGAKLPAKYSLPLATPTTSITYAIDSHLIQNYPSDNADTDKLTYKK